MLPHGEAGNWASILREGLMTAGWVARWRPMETYLYDLWPLRRRGRRYTNLDSMPVEVIQKAKRSDELRSEKISAAAA